MPNLALLQPQLALLPLAEPVSNPVLVVAILLSTVLVAPLLSRLARAPEIIGLIVAGILLGPPLMNVVDRDETIVLLGTVGLLYIMLRAGLEMDIVGFLRYRGRSLGFGSLSFLIPQGLGALAAWTLLGMSWPAAILLGSMFGSHTLLAYPIASRLGLSTNPAVTTVLGGSLVTDASALIVLAVVAGTVAGEVTTSFWVGLGAALIALVVGVFAVLPRIGRAFFRAVEGEDGGPQFLFILASVFIVAWLAERGGFAPIIGAFLAGLALNRLVPKNSALMNRIEFVGNTIFIPIFLISVGMLVDLRLLMSGQGIDVALLMSGCVLLAKGGAAWLSAAWFGYGREERAVMIGLSVPQAAATLAAVFVGFEIGLFDEAIINGTVVMILVTCLVGPSLVERYGRALVLKMEAAVPDIRDKPQRILVPLANPASTQSLMNLAMMIRRKNSGQPLYPLTVAQSEGSVDAQVAAGERLLATAVRQAAAADVPVIPVTRVDVNIANGIARALSELRISAVVIGWNGQVTTRDRVFGSVLDQVLHATHQTLFVCKVDAPLSTFKRMVVAIPSLLERDPAFYTAWKDVKIMADQMGCSLVLVGTAPTLEALTKASKAIEPRLPEKTVVLSDWRHLRRELRQVLGADDLFLACLAREQSFAHASWMNRMPRDVAGMLAKRSFLFVYPPDDTSDEDNGEECKLTDAVFGSTLRSAVLLDEEIPGGMQEAIPVMLARAFHGANEVSPQLLESLTTQVLDASFEIAPGLLLLEAHATEAPTSRLVVARRVHDVQLAKERTPRARSVLLLLSPPQDSARLHLQRYTALSTRLTRLPEGALAHLSSVEALHQLLRPGPLPATTKGQRQPERSGPATEDLPSDSAPAATSAASPTASAEPSEPAASSTPTPS